MSYFVKIPEKYRRHQSRRSKYGREESRVKLAPVWTFNTESEAVTFAKSFQSCWVEVWHENKVLFRNFSTDKPKWLTDYEAQVIREKNEKIQQEKFEQWIDGQDKAQGE